MHFRPDLQDEVFRNEVRRFLKEKLPADMARRRKRHYTATRADLRRWQRILFDHGWAAPHWPREHGGTGWTWRQRMIFDAECAAAHAPPINVQGITYFGPVLNEFGTPAQKQKFLPALLRGDIMFCQGFSEPGSGSDLASLRTRAVRDGERWIINGQKTWTTEASMAEWMFLLVRTNPEAKKQQGISFFVVDMKTPGITVRPIVTIDGQHHLNEVFFENVIVPADGLIGSEGQGWAITKFLLNFERIIGTADIPSLLFTLARIRELASAAGGQPLMRDPMFAARFARLEIDTQCIAMKVSETLSKAALTDRELAVIGSTLKSRATEIFKAASQLALEVLGDDGAVFHPDPEREGAPASEPVEDPALGVAASYFYSRAASIYGGTNEIQRNIIAKARFGL